MKLSDLIEEFVPGVQGWFVVKRKEQTVSNGPYPTRQELERDLKKMPWYDPKIHELAYGREGEDFAFSRMTK